MSAGVRSHAGILQFSSQELARLAPHLAALTRHRDEAILSLRAEGWGYDRIAKEAGLSKQRIVQIVKRLESRESPLTTDADGCTVQS